MNMGRERSTSQSGARVIFEYAYLLGATYVITDNQAVVIMGHKLAAFKIVA